ncbi:AlpA family transcriptional regulator [uncultured Shewanella sp.]|uniref:helix-turn-helix transcriptional regulator n=1 Tax=uncultured Shewanella sp. TaxID=173975 RepID=UPI00260E0D67|nr:AlpA family phage regulatory protein [uncultured Shewanella sp.]
MTNTTETETVNMVLKTLAAQLLSIAELAKQDSFLGLEEVMQRTKLKKVTIYTQMSKDLFPANTKADGYRAVWRASEIQSYIALGPKRWAELHAVAHTH